MATASVPVTTVPAASFQPDIDNHYEMSDANKTLQLTYRLQTAGPLTPGATTGPSLQYVAADGRRLFTGEEIAQETTTLGTMLTVGLEVVADLRSVTLTLFLPRVVHQHPGSPQSFEAFAVRAQHDTSFTGTPSVFGGNPTYKVTQLHGTASKVQVPL